MSAPSLAGYIIKRPWLKRWMMPLANWEEGGAKSTVLLKRLPITTLIFDGDLKLILGNSRADDLIPEESDTVLLALKRLPPKEAYDRVFRLRRAFQCSLAHQLLPKDQQTKPEEDYAYLSPIIKEIESESRERDDLEAMVVSKRKK